MFDQKAYNHQYYLTHKATWRRTKMSPEWHRQYYETHKAQWKHYGVTWRANGGNMVTFNWRAALKDEVFTHYSPTKTCVRCGYGDMRALSIDHINGGGKNKLGGAGFKLYKWLKDHGFPDGFQVLCMNCQWLKRHERKEYGR